MKKHALVPLLLSAAALAGCSSGDSSVQEADAGNGTTTSSTMTFDTSAQTTTTAAPETTSAADTTAASADTTAQHETESSDDTDVSYPADEQLLVDEAYSAGFQDGYEKAVQSLRDQKLWISGDFTATVRKILPDYVSDPETPRVAVLTMFQDGPFTLGIAPELLADLEEGETYTFVLKEQEVEGLCILKEDGELYFTAEDLQGRRIELSEIRKPTEDEYGLLCDRVKAVESTNAVG